MDIKGWPPDIVGGAVIHYGIVAEYTGGYRSSHAIVDTVFRPSFLCGYCKKFDYKVPAEFIFLTPGAPYRHIYTCYIHRGWGEDRLKKHHLEVYSNSIGVLLEEFSHHYDHYYGSVLSPPPPQTPTELWEV